MPESATISIHGMNCQHCSQKVHSALTATPGVLAASVDLAAAHAHITYDPAATSMPRLMQAIAATGFTPTAFTRNKPA